MGPLRYIDVVLLVVAAPILLLIGVPPLGYGVAAGVWLALRVVEIGVNRSAAALGDQNWEMIVRQLAYPDGADLRSRITVILIRRDADDDAGLTALDRGRARVHDPLLPRLRRPSEGAMSKRKKILWGSFAFYVAVLIVLVAVYGIHGQKNSSFQIQNEFMLTKWVDLGPFSINRAVVYLFITTILTVGTMMWIARRMQARPNRVQTSVEALYSLMRENITRGNMPDRMAAQWFPVLRDPVPVHLVRQHDRLPPAADQQRGEVHHLRRPHPLVRAVRRHRQRVRAVDPGDRGVPRVQLGGPPRPGIPGLHAAA